MLSYYEEVQKHHPKSPVYMNPEDNLPVVPVMELNWLRWSQRDTEQVAFILQISEMAAFCYIILLCTQSKQSALAYT
jgi:hypothetical protein